jgi:hypothetical protein
MDKETLAKAKQLEEDIRLISNATDYYRTQHWSHWDHNNDRPDTFHFDFCKNYSGNNHDCVHLPRWMNQKLMTVLYQEKNRLQEELDALGNDPEIITDVPEPYVPGDDVEHDIPVMPAPNGHKRKAPAPKVLTRMADRMASWVIYSLLFCLLFCLAGWQYTTRELIALSLALGFFAGSINNIERVLRELFEKKKKED